jgi:hypothetical protein
MNMTLRPGEALVCRWGHTEPARFFGSKEHKFVERICNGLWEYRPDLSLATWRKGADRVQAIVSGDDGLKAEVEKTGEIVWTVRAPYVLVGGKLEIEGTGARFAISWDGKTWEKAGSDLFKPIVGRGSAFADIDGDGDLDAVLTQVGGPPLLLRNDQDLRHHWLRLKLVGTKSNRSAIGAWVKVSAGGQTLARQVMPTRSYLSQSELPVAIGLGPATRPDEVEIKWPSGTIQGVDSVNVDNVTTVVENP